MLVHCFTYFPVNSQYKPPNTGDIPLQLLHVLAGLEKLRQHSVWREGLGSSLGMQRKSNHMHGTISCVIIWGGRLGKSEIWCKDMCQVSNPHYWIGYYCPSTVTGSVNDFYQIRCLSGDVIHPSLNIHFCGVTLFCFKRKPPLLSDVEPFFCSWYCTNVSVNVMYLIFMSCPQGYPLNIQQQRSTQQGARQEMSWRCWFSGLNPDPIQFLLTADVFFGSTREGGCEECVPLRPDFSPSHQWRLPAAVLFGERAS